MIWVFVWIATQIITESFPISSSSHVRLVEMYMQRIGSASWLSSVPKHFEDFLHLPTLCILLVFFGSRWLYPFMHLDQSWPVFVPFVFRVVLACAVTVGFYLLWAHTGWKDSFSIQWGLMITAGLLFSLLLVPQPKKNDAELLRSYMQKVNIESGAIHTESLPVPSIATAVCLGAVQGMALLPGISRMAATFVAGRWAGMSNEHAMEFSCAIQAPLLGAAIIRGLLELVASQVGLQLLNGYLALGMLFSGIMAYYCFYFTWVLAISGRLWWFGWYVVGLVGMLLI